MRGRGDEDGNGAAGRTGRGGYPPGCRGRRQHRGRRGADALCLNNENEMTETSKMSIQFPEPARISRLQLPERKAEIGMSLREGERVLEVNASRHSNLIDLTYADTKRFPAPDYAIKAFTQAATAGGLSYTAYRGGKSVRAAVAANVGSF